MRARGWIGAAVCALVLSAPAAAGAAPVLEVAMDHDPVAPSGIVPGRYVTYEVVVSNVGDEPTSAPIAIALSAPAGLTATRAEDELFKYFPDLGHIWSCTIPDSQSAECEGPELEGAPLAIAPGEEACEGEGETAVTKACRALVTFAAGVELKAGETLTPTVEVCGGGAVACASASAPTPVLDGYGFTVFDGLTEDEAGEPFARAGGHPFVLGNDIQLALTQNELGFTRPAGGLKDIVVTLPPGLIGNPQAVPTRCTEAELATDTCPTDSQVGLNEVLATDGSKSGDYPVYSMVPPPGRGAEFGFNIEGIVWVHIYADARVDGRIEVSTENVNEIVAISGNLIDFWGVPADPAHDPKRSCGGILLGCSSGAEEEVFLSLPTSCTGPPLWRGATDSWEAKGARLADGSPDLSDPNWKTASFESHDLLGSPLGTEGCNALDYSSPATKPDVQARPTTNVADAPSGLDVDVHVPQSTDPEGVAEAHLRDTVLTLPAGMAINPAGANGLDGCTPAQIGIDAGTGEPDGAAPTCPDAAKIGTVEVETPLLDHPAPGAVYAATPHDNPFDSLLAIYIVVDDPVSGTLLKLAGEVQADPVTGQLTTTVADAPQLPFEHFRVHLKSGAGAPLRTPATCGEYASSTELTPWSAPDSGPPVTVADSYAISQAPGGGACATSADQQPGQASFEAGTVSPVAAAYTPFTMDLRREDGSQRFASLSVSPPPGLLARLAGTPYCPEAALAAAAAKTGAEELAAPSCPAASQVGTVTAGAGAGPSPYYVQGSVYLAGPYEGAPLSLAVITPAVAGPYDLGTVAVRAALHVDPESARVSAVSDPIPTILQGVPLDVRSIRLALDRPSFTRNGTSCDPMAVSGQLLFTTGASTALASPFQLGECSALRFKPRLNLRLRGGTRRGAHPALRAVLKMPPGANLANVSVALPRSAYLEQSHIRTICTRVQFAADACPPGSIYGRAVATSPLLDSPLAGPVYLRSSAHKLPDLVLDLRGQIHVVVAGRIDSVRGGIRTSFEAAPDAPVSRVVVRMKGGKKGLIVNSRNLCARTYRATVLAEGQNGKAFDTRPKLRAKCKAKGKHKKRRAHRRAARVAR